MIITLPVIVLFSVLVFVFLSAVLLHVSKGKSDVQLGLLCIVLLLFGGILVLKHAYQMLFINVVGYIFMGTGVILCFIIFLKDDGD